jgi:hypothetical protein
MSSENKESSLMNNISGSSFGAVFDEEEVRIEKYMSFVWIVYISALFVTGIFFFWIFRSFRNKSLCYSKRRYNIFGNCSIWRLLIA